MNFAGQLRWGQIGEGYIAMWLRRKGWHILPVYETEIDTGKGPRLFMAQKYSKHELIAPDLLAIKADKFVWVEAKRKSRFSWYGRGQHWCTGIDKRHFIDYCAVESELHLPVWLMFLHTESDTWATDVERWAAPPTCPVGLYGQVLRKLREIGRESDKYASGMVYWNIKDLKRLAQLSEVIPVSEQTMHRLRAGDVMAGSVAIQGG